MSVSKRESVTGNFIESTQQR